MVHHVSSYAGQYSSTHCGQTKVETMIVGSGPIQSKKWTGTAFDGCLWIQASLHENAKILKHRTLALSEELRPQADMGGQLADIAPDVLHAPIT